MITKKQVAEIRDFFDNYERNMNQLWSGMTDNERHNSLSDNMTSSKSAENLKSDERQHGDGIVKMLYGQHFRKNQSPLASSSTPNLSNSFASPRLMPLLRPLRKYFYLPEDKIHSSELVEKRQHFDKSYGKQNSSGISNSSDSVGVERIGATKNHDDKDSPSPPLKGKFSSSLSECDQKILQSNDSQTNDAIKINESSVALEPSRSSAPTLIKNNNSIVCGRSDPKCGGNELDSTQQQHDDDASTSTLDDDSRRRSRDLKPIKSLTTSQRQPDHHRQQHNLILMNDDCKFLQGVEQEASTSTSPSGTCADKRRKNSPDDDDKNTCRINEISATNSRINRKHNLNLDLYFDKELSSWLAERERVAVGQRQIELSGVDNEDDVAITNTDEMAADDVGWKSCGKLSSDSSDVDVDGNDNSSHPHDDSFSSSTSSATCANSEIDVPLIDARRRHDRLCAKADNGAESSSVGSAIFTDGEFIYGPYNFDLFWNEFYQFRDGCDRLDDAGPANDDEAESHGNKTHGELLKNHDEVDNNAEVSFVRDVDAEATRGCGILRNDNNNNWSNNDRVEIEINVTNCSDDDGPDFTSSDRNDDVAFDRNFNYAPSDGRGHNLIDLMDECDSYVSNNRSRRARLLGDLHIGRRPTTMAMASAAIYAEDSDAPFVVALHGMLNNAQQFNYERDKIVEITDENEYLFASPPKVECSETCDDALFSNDQRQRKFIVDGQRSDDDTKNKIRFKEHGESHRQPDSPQPHPSSSSEAKCDELDNCFCESRIDVGGGRR